MSEWGGGWVGRGGGHGSYTKQAVGGKHQNEQINHSYTVKKDGNLEGIGQTFIYEAKYLFIYEDAFWRSSSNKPDIVFVIAPNPCHILISNEKKGSTFLTVYRRTRAERYRGLQQRSPEVKPQDNWFWGTE